MTSTCFVDYLNETIQNTSSTNSIDSGETGLKISTSQEGLLVGCFFYGYVSTHIFGSWISLRIGFKRVLLVSTLVSGQRVLNLTIKYFDLDTHIPLLHFV